MRLFVPVRRSRSVWLRSSYCASNECVEITRENGAVVLRNSSQPRKIVRYSTEEWAAFAKGLRAGDFTDFD